MNANSQTGDTDGNGDREKNPQKIFDIPQVPFGAWHTGDGRWAIKVLRRDLLTKTNFLGHEDPHFAQKTN
jgi:hypothetical protein